MIAAATFAQYHIDNYKRTCERSKIYETNKQLLLYTKQINNYFYNITHTIVSRKKVGKIKTLHAV